MLLLLAAASISAHAAEPSKEPILRIEAGMHTAMIYRISADESGRFAVTTSDDKTARVWEIASGKLLQILRPPIGEGNEGRLSSVAMSPDGQTVAVGGRTKLGSDAGHTVYLFDRASGRLLRRLTGAGNVIWHLAFSPDGRWLAAAVGGKNGVRVWSLAESGIFLEDTAYGGSSNGAVWSKDGRLAVTSLDGQIRLYQVGNGILQKVAAVKAPGGEQPFDVAFSPDGRELAVGYVDTPRVDILDGQNLNLRFTPSSAGMTSGDLSAVVWSADGRQLLGGGAWGQGGFRLIRCWPDAGRGTPVDTPTVGSTIMSLQPLPNGTALLGAADPAWGIFDSAVAVAGAAAWQPRGVPPTADLRGSLGQNGFASSIDGREVQFQFEASGKSLHRFNVVTRVLAAGRDASLRSPLTEGLAVQDWRDTTVPKLAGRPIALQQYESSRSLAIAPEATGFVLGTGWFLRHFDAKATELWAKPVPGTAWGVNIPPSGKIVIAAYGDGTIRWHRLSDGQELLAFFPQADRKRWVLWTPSGYYDASPGGEELIGWHVNRSADEAADFFPASRFRDRFYRPDIIDRVLDTLDEGRAVTQANEARGTRPQGTQNIAQVLPPVVELVSSAEISTASPQVTLRVRGRSAADAPVTGWRIRVNGQAVADARGLGRQETATPSGDKELTVAVPPQNSEIQVFAENLHGVSTPATVRVRWAGAAPQAAASPGGFQIQPKLYVLAIGVAAYQHADIAKLGLPAKDARDFAAAMRRQQGKLYRQVEVKLLTDGQATRDDIVDGLEWLQRQVTQNDLAMIFIAGHGVNDATQGYTFLPVNADPDKLRRTGVGMDEFKKTLANLPGKAVFFFDTCHSGNVLGAKSRAGPSDISGVINELAAAENGVVVFSSSTGRQLSYEDAAWGNGAFTKALVEGIDGAADYQKTGRITHNMLNLYISERVKTLTAGKQSPVTQAPGGVPDFPLAMR